MTDKETKNELKPKVQDDDLVELLQAKADAGEIKTAAAGLKAIRNDGMRVAQKRVYLAFKSVVIPAPEAEEEDEDETISEEPVEAVAEEETESWDEEE